MTNCDTKKIKIYHLQTPAQFQAVLQQSTKVKSIHFMLHYRLADLSTDEKLVASYSVDNCCQKVSRLGLIIPKRWAKHAVTRSLIKRQSRAEFACMAGILPAGDWVVRLRNTFDQKQWVSCASVALKQSVRQELQILFQRAHQVCTGAMP